jgi:hypothetical protein
MPRKPDPRVKAVELLGRWTRLAQGHVPLGAGCSCGAPALTVRMADLERDVLYYIGIRYPAARSTSSIADLLRGMAAAPDENVLADLERSLESFEEMHR